MKKSTKFWRQIRDHFTCKPVFFISGYGFSSFPEIQATKDLTTGVTIALEAPSHLRPAALEQAQAEWSQTAADFWRAHGGAGAETPKKGKTPANQHRSKAGIWLAASHHMLQSATGRGWEQWLVPEEDPPGFSARPTLTVSIDQGSDGWSAMNFLCRAKRANCLVIPDTSHRLWNDCEAAIKDSLLWPSCLCGIVLLNLDTGPWSQSKWFSESQQACLEYAEVHTDSCPIFQGLCDRIALEQNLLHLRGSGEYEPRVLDALFAAFERKNSRVAMSRWFGYIDSMGSFCKNWSSRLAIYLYICAQLGLCKQGASLEKIRAKLVQRTEEEDLGKATTAEDRESVRVARNMCKNTVEFAATLMWEQETWQVQKGLVEICMHLRMYHSEQNKLNRSAKESLEFFRDSAVGGCIKPIRQTFLGSVQHCGFWSMLGLSTAGCSLAGIDKEHPLVVSEDEVASRLCTLALNLAKHRLRHAGWHTAGVGFPAGLVHEVEGDNVLDKMQAHKIVWDELCKKADDHPWWKRILDRSHMKLMISEQVYGMCEASEWTMTDELKQLISKMYSGITQTKLIEDAMRDERMAEISKNFGRKVSFFNKNRAAFFGEDERTRIRK